MTTLAVIKDEHSGRPVPIIWRNTLTEMAEALKNGDCALMATIEGVNPVSTHDAQAAADYIRDYGCQLISLPDTTWTTSFYQWQGCYWDVIVDLYTEEEGCSDMVMQVKIQEDALKYRFEFHMVYVP